jgi:transposase
VKSSRQEEYESGSVNNDSNFKLEKPEKGRPNCLSEEKLQQLLEVYYSKPFSLRKLAKMFGVSRMTVWRVVQQFTLSEVIDLKQSFKAHPSRSFEVTL